MTSFNTYEYFTKVDIRIGKIIEVYDFPEARKPAYKLHVDFGGQLGIKKSSAQLMSNYTKEELVNKFVLGVVNFPPKQIGPFKSEVLVLGVPDKNNNTILVIPDVDVPLGGKLN